MPTPQSHKQTGPVNGYNNYPQNPPQGFGNVSVNPRQNNQGFPLQQQFQPTKIHNTPNSSSGHVVSHQGGSRFGQRPPIGNYHNPGMGNGQGSFYRR